MTDKPKASSHDSYGQFTLLSVVLPMIGLILGIVYLTKDSKLDKKLGEHLLAVSVLFMLIWSGGWWFWTSNRSTPTYTSAPTVDTLTAPITPSWDYQAAYDKVQTGMTKAQVEAAIGKSSTDCTQAEVQGYKAESCTYGGAADHGIVVVQYDNGNVSSKSKSGI